MQKDIPDKTIEPCDCGFRPDHYTCGYGPTPYYISCLRCGKSLHGGSGYPPDFIKKWNDIYRHIKAPKTLIDLQD